MVATRQHMVRGPTFIAVTRTEDIDDVTIDCCDLRLVPYHGHHGCSLDAIEGCTVTSPQLLLPCVLL